MILRDGSDFEPDPESMNILIAAYPVVNIPAELAKMRAWCLANPSKRKTRRGALRFINQWLTRAQQQLDQRRTVLASIAAVVKPMPVAQRQDYTRMPVVRASKPDAGGFRSDPTARERIRNQIDAMRRR